MILETHTSLIAEPDDIGGFWWFARSTQVWAQRLVQPIDGGSDSSLDPYTFRLNAWQSLGVVGLAVR
jgi:hypothetical protein